MLVLGASATAVLIAVLGALLLVPGTSASASTSARTSTCTGTSTSTGTTSTRTSTSNNYLTETLGGSRDSPKKV